MPEFKYKKTKLMKTNRAKEDLKIKVNGETLETVSKYVYWGSTRSGDGMEEIRKTCYGNAQTNKDEILVEGSRCSNKTKNSQSLHFPHSYIW